MKQYIKPPMLSTSFSESSKGAKKRFENILNTKTKRAGAAVIAVIVLASAIIGASVALKNPSSEEQTKEKKALAERIYETKHTYIGDASANGKTAAALGIAFGVAQFENELQTSEEPYGWIFNFDESYAEWQQENDEDMLFYSTAILALIDNLGYVEWHYPGETGGSRVTEEDANAFLGRSVKEYGESLESFTALMEFLNLENRTHTDNHRTVLCNADPEEFKKAALIITDDGAENTEALNEFLNELAFGNYASLDIVQYTEEGKPILMRILTDGSVFWGGEYVDYGEPNPDNGNATSEYNAIQEFSHLKIMRDGYGGTTFYLVNNETLTAKEITEYLLSSAHYENPPVFRILFRLDGKEGEKYAEAVY